MSAKPVRFHRAALDETDAAAAWYGERSRAAQIKFLEELDWAIARIARDPHAFAPFTAGTRRILLPHFPYQVIFRETAGAIEEIAVAHTRRRPGHWRRASGRP
jgi:plasmid stabilization system protein ParE